MERSKTLQLLGYDLPAAPYGISLLAQLILNELIKIRKKVLQLQNIAFSVQHQEGIKNNLIMTLNDLIEQRNTPSPQYSWSSQQSILSRLKRYLELSSLQKDDTAPLTSLRHYTENVERQTRQLFFALEGEAPFRQLRENIHRLASASESCIRHFSGWIKSSNNENLLLYLLQKREELITCFGEASYNELICEGFGSPNEMAEFLFAQFKARGFDNFSATLQSLLSASFSSIQLETMRK